MSYASFSVNHSSYYLTLSDMTLLFFAESKAKYCCSIVFQKMAPLSFEKDDDENGHIDFITAASVSSSVDLKGDVW